jgi:signal transduction histidine kinase/DNA-binding response OmpR family regulator
MKEADHKNKIFARECRLQDKHKEVVNNESLSKDELRQEYIELGKEYGKLLRSAIKITRIGDANQRKLANQGSLLKEQAEKLKEMAEVKSRFFANISHEFRTPLTLIMGPLEQMLSRPGSQEDIKKLSLMLRNAQRLLSLINQLLELAKFESGRVKLQAGEQNIIPFLKGIVSCFELLARQKEVDLTFHTEKENLTLFFEPAAMEEVMGNLLINALKFTPHGGRIKVSVRGYSSGSGEKVEITVRDTGPGIPGDRQASVFDRFYQIDRTFEHHQKGSGIGLALVREYITLHHGEIDVNSSEGKGTEFVIRLPMGRAHLAPDEIINQSISPADIDSRVPGWRKISARYAGLLELKNELPGSVGGEINDIETGKPGKNIVLVVEDSADMREYIKGALEPDYQLVEAANGREGIEVAAKIIPDIIISDIIMPEVDGLELCRKLKSDVKTCHIPVIMLTAKASEESVVRGLETGADDYITKPFNTRILCARVKNLIDLRRHLQLTLEREMVLQPEKVAVSPIDRDFITDLQRVIEENLSDPDFNVDRLGKKLYMSSATVYRKIQALSGKPPTAYIRSYRLKRAAQLLGSGFGSVTDVAFEVGFSSPSYFTDCFKKQFHCLPSSFHDF